MMLEISLNHLVRFRTRSGAKIIVRPKVPPPMPFPEHPKIFEKFRRVAPLDPLHCFARNHRRGSRHEYVDMVLAHNSPDYPNLESFACLSGQFSDSKSHVAFQNLLEILRNPYEMVFDGITFETINLSA